MNNSVVLTVGLSTQTSALLAYEWRETGKEFQAERAGAVFFGGPAHLAARFNLPALKRATATGRSCVICLLEGRNDAAVKK
jgi:hypothetical protein